tara:strand:- start:1924 stop:2220 length:297 start_codon:yes stop_codon:yes gene_type:complete
MYAYLLTYYTSFKSAHPVPRPRKPRATGLGLLRRGLCAAIRGWQCQRTIAALQQLDDQLLRDIGLYCSDIPKVITDMDAMRPRRANPSSRLNAPLTQC